MKKGLFTIITISLASLKVMAGNMGVEQKYNFDGLYIGLGAGVTTVYTQGTINSSISSIATPIISTSIPITTTDMLFAGNIGYGKMFSTYNYLGVKGSIYYKPGENAGNNVFFGQVPNTYYFTDNTTTKRNMQPFYNIDAILGYEILPKLLPYIEGGVSFANIKTSYSNAATAYSLTTSLDYNETIKLGGYKTGFNVGIGANYLLSKNLFIFSELVYNNFGTQNTTLVDELGAVGITKNVSLSVKNQAAFFIAGAAYKFI